MDLQTFKDSLAGDSPPDSADLALQAMWYEAKGDWDKAHSVAQDKNDQIGAWVHAYLHRVEGDEFNAGYWYRRANKPHSKATLAEEWAEIATSLCG